MKQVFLYPVLLFCLLATVQNALAQTTPTLNIQGVLRNSNQTAVDNGIYKIRFSLYAAETGGIAVWSETQDSVNVSGGVYSTALGKVTPMTAAFNQTYYLGVKVGAGAEMTPRALLSSAPYALALIGQSNLFASAGNVGIGTLAPVEPLHIKGAAPTALFQDTDGNSGFIHQNGNRMNFLSGGVNATTPALNGSYHPLSLNMGNDEATFGGPAYFMEGNVGIGTTSPIHSLHMQGAAPTIGFQDGDGNSGFIHQNGNQMHFLAGGVNGTTWVANGNYFPLTLNMANDAATFGGSAYFMEGRVGIGTTTPRAPLEVFALENNTFNGGYFMNTVGAGALGQNQTHPTSILASHFISSGLGFIASSDRRIKKDLRPCVGGNDLASLRQLRVTDYRKIDRVNYGDGFQKGFIAQEVEEVFPEAIQLSEDFIPNVYELAAKTALTNGLLHISLDKKHGFAAGDEVKMIFPNGEQTLLVSGTPSETTFTVNWSKPAPEKIFVFGKKVADFHTVDYDRIFTLNVSATQELARKVEALEKENAGLRQQVGELKTEAKASADKTEARFRALENRLAN